MTKEWFIKYLQSKNFEEQAEDSGFFDKVYTIVEDNPFVNLCTIKNGEEKSFILKDRITDLPRNFFFIEIEDQDGQPGWGYLTTADYLVEEINNYLYIVDLKKIKREYPDMFPTIVQTDKEDKSRYILGYAFDVYEMMKKDIAKRIA